jgi:hypothetical protein
MRPKTSTPTTATLRALALGLGLLATTACAGGDVTGPSTLPSANIRAQLAGGAATHPEPLGVGTLSGGGGTDSPAHGDTDARLSAGGTDTP